MKNTVIVAAMLLFAVQFCITGYAANAVSKKAETVTAKPAASVQKPMVQDASLVAQVNAIDKAVKLTPEQKGKLTAIQKEFNSKKSVIANNLTDEGFAQRRSLKAARDKKISEVLTPEQMKKYTLLSVPSAGANKSVK